MELQPIIILVLIVTFISVFLLLCALFLRRRERLLEAERVNRLLASRAARANQHVHTRSSTCPDSDPFSPEQPTASDLRLISESFPISEFSEGQLTKGGDSCCSVCLVDYEPKDKVQLTPCQHSFHADCLQTWLHTNSTCPMCRVSFAVPHESVVSPQEAAIVQTDVDESHTPAGTVCVGDTLV